MEPAAEVVDPDAIDPADAPEGEESEGGESSEEEPADDGDVCTHRILVEPDEGASDSVRVLLLASDSDVIQAERTVPWDGAPTRTDELIGAIRELAGLTDV